MSFSIPARLEHRLYIEIQRKRLQNKNPTIISNNCVGGIICHDLKLNYNSPTVNIGIMVPEYIKFLQNMDHYLNEPFIYGNRTAYGWPVADWGDIWILFAHTPSYEYSVNKFTERISRMDKNNMFITMTDSLNCTYDDLVAFDQLPYEHKVVFTHKPYPEIKSAYYIKGFEDKQEVGVLSDWKPGFWKRRYIDDFDYVSFLNGR